MWLTRKAVNLNLSFPTLRPPFPEALEPLLLWTGGAIALICALWVSSLNMTRMFEYEPGVQWQRGWLIPAVAYNAFPRSSEEWTRSRALAKEGRPQEQHDLLIREAVLVRFAVDASTQNGGTSWIHCKADYSRWNRRPWRKRRCYRTRRYRQTTRWRKR